MRTVSTLDPAVRVSPAALVREPLTRAAAAALVGSAVGLAGTLSVAAWQSSFVSLSSPGSIPPRPFLASWADPSGGLLAALSLLGVPLLLGRRSWAAKIGGVLLFLWLAASLSPGLYPWLWPPEPASGGPPFAYLLMLHASLWLGSAAVFPFALGALLAGRRRLGAVLLVLSVPDLLLLLGYSALFGEYPSPSATTVLAGLLPGAGVGVPEAALWTLLGVLLLGEARARALARVWRDVAEENKAKALRLYEEGFGRGDLSVTDELTSDDFRDLRHGGRGKRGMRRAVKTLRGSFPDLAVSVEGQEAEGDLVRTRLLLSGTDRGGACCGSCPRGGTRPSPRPS